MENMITACRQRERELPWGREWGEDWKILMEAGPILPVCAHQGRDILAPLTAEATNSKHDTPAQNGNFLWKSVSNKRAPMLEGPARLRKNYVALCKGLSSAPIATHQEELNFSCDLYHGLALKKNTQLLHTALHLLCKPLIMLVLLGALFFGSE